MSSFVTDVTDNTQTIEEISSIQFGVYSNEEKLKMSVARIHKTKLSTDHGCVYDTRMGTLENDKECETCEKYPKKCPGHFGHIELNHPVLNPLFYKQIKNILSTICIKCYRFILKRDQVELKNLNKYKGKNRFSKILSVIKKTSECSHCGNPQPEFKFVQNENNIYMVYKEGDEKITLLLSTQEIQQTFEKIIDEDIELMGFDKKNMSPKNLILSIFLVIPPAARPYVISDGNFCDDDLTNQILEIIKINNALGQDKIPQNKAQKLIQSLKFRITTFYNNSNGKAKHSTNGRPIKGIKERLTGKSGQIRDNLMGEYTPKNNDKNHC